MIIIHSEKKKQKYLLLLKSGSDFRLSYTRQEVFGNLVLSLDKIRKKLMISDVLNPLKLIQDIDLRKIRFITIKKVYRDILRGELVRGKLEDFLETMHFQFEFSDGSQALFLPIFERNIHDAGDMAVLERRAVIWQLLLSKLKLQ